jgi:uncharacterized protein YegP (UPF0339 family)
MAPSLAVNNAPVNLPETVAPVKFEYWKSSIDQQWYWHLKNGTNHKVAQGESYPTKAECLHAIDEVRQASSAEVKSLSRETDKK